MGGNSEQITTVTIYNQTYHVRSGDDSEYVRKLARYVDQKMLELSEQTPTVDTLKVAILAALNIADEYLNAKQELEDLRRTVDETSERLTALLQQYVEPDSA